jgi:peptidyl-prolyl cis-trans isomerase A (cyclophilin A)
MMTLSTSGRGRSAVRAVAGLCTALLAGCAPVTTVPPAPDPPSLLQPGSAALNQTAPDTFKVLFETTAGDFIVEAARALAPLGADRFYNLVQSGYFTGVRFFRVVPGFVVQFGLHGDPAVSAVWRDQRIGDDSVRTSNVRGSVSFAQGSEPGTRTVQLFINLADNSRLDAQGFAPFARVTGGMDTVERLHSGYGEAAPRGRGPSQAGIHAEGEAFLSRDFPELDRIVRTRILSP